MWWNDSSIVITIHAVHHGLELRSERAFAIDTGINNTKLGITLILAIDRYYTSCSLVANSGGGILENSALHLYVSALFYSARFSFSRNQFELCDVGSVCDLVTSASSKNNLFNISTTCAYLAPAALSSCKQKIGQIHWTPVQMLIMTWEETLRGERRHMRIDPEVLNSFDLIITKSTSDSSVVSVCV